MCRGLSDPNHRRCPSSGGHERRNRDRAKYAANRAAGLTRPVNEALTAAPQDVFIEVSLEDAACQVRERIHNTFHVGHGKNLGHSTMSDDYRERLAALAALPASDGIDSWKELEQDVRAIGQALEDRAAQIAGFTAEDAAERHMVRVARAKEEIDPFYDRLSKVNNQIRDTQGEIWTAERENPDEDHGELLAQMAALKATRDSIQQEADTRGAVIARDFGFGDIGPHEVNGTIRKIQQGFDPMTLADTKILADARLVALKEVRDFGGTIELNDNSSKRVAGIMAEVAQHYPADWVRMSNTAGNLKVKDTKGRAHYNQASSQRVRKQSTEVRWRDAGEEPEGDGWVSGVWTGNGWSNPIENPDAVEKYAQYANTDSGERSVAWYRPAFKTRRSYRYYDGESVTGPPPRGWTEAFETLSDGSEIRVFRQPAWRMTHGETVSELTVDKDRSGGQWQETAGFGTALHEFGHRAEHMNPAITELEEAFLLRRTTGEDGQRDKLTNLYLSNRERGRSDSFADKYMGKEYNNGYREVLSTGMEGIFAGAFGSLAGINGKTPDADMRAFILGVLATA